jgi:hypothetical protein
VLQFLLCVRRLVPTVRWKFLMMTTFCIAI